MGTSLGVEAKARPVVEGLIISQACVLLPRLPLWPTIASEIFAMLSKASPWKRTTALRKTVMYSLGFADGRTGYVVVPQELVEHGDEDVPSIARERQRRGEVPGGDIISVKRVR